AADRPVRQEAAGDAGRLRVPEGAGRMRLRLLILLLAAAALAAAATASAAPSFRITEAQSSFPERAYVLSLPQRMHLHGGQVQVFENGQPVPELEVVASESAASTKQFGVVLVIDASQSMEGKPEVAALAAARA